MDYKLSVPFIDIKSDDPLSSSVKLAILGKMISCSLGELKCFADFYFELFTQDGANTLVDV